MKLRVDWLAALTLALTLSLPLEAAAQGRGQGRDRDRDRSRDRGSVVTRDGIQIAPAQQFRALANAPAYCGSGAGHPAFGRQWCLQKGFGLGRDRGTWATARMGDLAFRTTRRDTGRELNRNALEAILGADVLRSLDARGRQLGSREPITGRWLPGDGRGHTLFLRSGIIPIAELVDRTGNGRVDLVLLNMGR